LMTVVHHNGDIFKLGLILFDQKTRTCTTYQEICRRANWDSFLFVFRSFRLVQKQDFGS